MADNPDDCFTHRVNEVGVFESICHDCLRTVSTGAKESDLACADDHHICKEVIKRLIRQQQGLTSESIN